MQIGKQEWPFLNKSFGFSIPEYDEILLEYDGNNNISVVRYKKDSVLVGTINLEYDLNGNLINIQHS